MEQLPVMDQSRGGARPKKPRSQFYKNVLLLKNSNFRRIDGQVYMPTESEISTIKTSAQLRQFRKGVEFCASMSEDEVKKKLQETFPYLENTSFSCAAVVKPDKERKRFEFDGPPHLWNGKTIRSRITGNSALYILEDEVPDSKTELNATNIQQGDDDATSLIATDVNRMSLLDDSQMEIDENHQEPSSDESVTVQSGKNNAHQNQVQMSDSSEEGTSSADNASTSGIGGEFSEEELSLLRWLKNSIHYEVAINPKESPLKGGTPCRFTFNPKLQQDVTSGRATFGNLGVVELERSTSGSLSGDIPASPVPGWVPIIVESQDGIQLGRTEIYYGDPVEDILQLIVIDPSLQKRLLDKYKYMGLGGNLQTSGAEAHHSETFGLNQPVKMLSLLVYVAAECGAQQFIDMIFTSSAGRIVFDAYKDSSTLPEVIAKDHGNEQTAHYLEGVTKRFSEEIRTGKECSQTIDWSELVKAAEEAQNRLDITSEEESYQIERDFPKETGYLGDDDTSSSESSEPHSSDSEDDISRTSTKEIQTNAVECKQPDLEHEDRLTQSPILFFKDGEFQREQANVKSFHFHETQPHKWKEDVLHLIQASCIQEAHNLRQLKSLHRSGISFLLGLGDEPVQHHLITAYQRLGYLLTLTKERNAYYKMQVNTAEARQSLEHSTTIVGNKGGHKSSSTDSLQQLHCRPVNEEWLFSRIHSYGKQRGSDCQTEIS